MKQKKEYIKGANPYLPLWEHIPDGEPRVFEYKGEKRVYIYGSHDTLKTEYCGPDQVVWSAPVDDLTNWTYHGVCYTSTDGSILYAPDVVQRGDTFYLYAAEAKGSRIMLAKSKDPAGPFTDPVLTELAFDPGILVDDDGRVYAYWGFCKSFCAELNDDMATIKKETLHVDPIPHCVAPWSPDDGVIDLVNGFFEASSIRKIDGKYVYIYSKRCNTPHPELGVDFDCNGFLSYVYSDKPLEGFVRGGDISFNGGEIIEFGDHTHAMTYQWGNNHGSLAQVNGEWYIFYHRQTGLNEYSRQAMLEPVEVAWDKDGHLFIGQVQYDGDGNPIGSKPVEMTSQGPHRRGLDAYKIISAGYACHMYGGSLKPYVEPVYEQTDTASSPVRNISNGTTVGFKYLEFTRTPASSLTMNLRAMADLTVCVHVDHYQGPMIAMFQVTKGAKKITTDLELGVSDHHSIYFEFLSNASGEIAIFDSFTFDK